jgi:aspartyl-tRNA synthetase
VIVSGQSSPPYATQLSLSPVRVILDQDSGVFFTWEQEQRIIEKLIYKRIYLDDLKGALQLYSEEANSHELTKKILAYNKEILSRVNADLNRSEKLNDSLNESRESYKNLYIKENRKVKRKNKTIIVIGTGGLIAGFLLGK